MVADVLLPIGAYVVGSVPSGYLLVRAFRGRDVRQYGSHNVGAINVFRVGGTKLGALTLIADIGKAVVVVLAAAAVTDRPWLIAASALAVLIGHAFSIWFLLREHRFSEGKSVASGLGVLLGLVIAGKLPWPVVATPLGVWAAGLLLPRLLTGRWWCISPATMAATLAIPVVVCATHPALPYQLLALLMSALILLRHKNNIRRLIAGTEPKLGEARVSA
jgi:glycerol-3-phosphate acyltransferase PlsY